MIPQWGRYDVNPSYDAWEDCTTYMRLVKAHAIRFTSWPILAFACHAYDWYYAVDGNSCNLAFSVVTNQNDYSIYQVNVNGTTAHWGAVNLAFIGF